MNFLIVGSRIVPIGLLASLLCGCWYYTAEIASPKPEALIEPLPVTVGVYFPTDLVNMEYRGTPMPGDAGRESVVYQPGPAIIETFDHAFGLIFENTVPVECATCSQLGTESVNGIVEFTRPAFRATQDNHPLPVSKDDNIHVWITFRVVLRTTDGDLLAEWSTTGEGYGRGQEAQGCEQWGSVNRLGCAVTNALYEAISELFREFPSLPGVQEWAQSLNEDVETI